jgi:hypothetical protein
MRHSPLVALTIALSLAACGPKPVPWTVLGPEATSRASFRMLGFVRHLDLEGGVFVIHGDDSVTYAPTNLPKEFQYDGTRVEADARRAEQAAGIQQVGHPVELLRIRQR